MIAILVLASFAQLSDPIMVKCTSVGGPILLDTKEIPVGLKCCLPGTYIDDPDHPVDARGNLVCSRET